MYFLYKELQRSAGAKLCCVCHFFDENTENIVACSSDTMTVYEIVKVHTGDQNGRPPYRLKIVGQYSFCGEILSIATIPLNKVDPESTLSNRDVIIMSFVGNYVSFLVYDNEEGDLCSIQCFDYNKECAIALNRYFSYWLLLYRSGFRN